VHGWRLASGAQAAGILAPLGASARNRAWEADDLLDLIAGLEAGEPPPPGTMHTS
jgi:hypothetical protein